ncbi:MAG: hypothetical protein EG826_04470 [Deltaproteobacteria bacterium]|nr:hypothetical protein [Deltaproteobacteria bacterium]
MFQVNYGELSPEALAQATDIAQKMEAVDGAIAALQNERTAASAEFDAKEHALQTEKANLREQLRALRQVSLTPATE